MIKEKKNTDLKQQAKKTYDIINHKKYTFKKRAKENDELYGSVKPKEIASVIQTNDKIEVKPAQIDLAKEINKIGNYEAKINLHAEIQSKILIEVGKEETSK